MKTSFLLIAFLLPSASTLATEETSYTLLPTPWDFLAVKDQTIKTINAFIVNNIEYWDEPGFHTGIQQGRLTFFSIKDIPEEFEAPEAPNVYIKYTDAYGNLEASHKKDISQDFKTMEFVEGWNCSHSVGCTVNKGGQYTVEFGLSPDLYKDKQEIVIKDEACARVYRTIFKKGEPMTSILNITDGYPFDASLLTGEYTLDWTLAPVESPTSIIAEGNETFSLETDKPLIASTSTMNLEFGSLEPGKYVGIISSDFAPAARTFDVEVNDVLQTDISFDKEQYVIGKDKEANLKISMKYGYPYISLNSDTGKPTIIIKAELLGQDYNYEFSNEVWSNSNVDYTADISVPLNNVSFDIAKEYDWALPMNIQIVFNGRTQMEKSIVIPVVDTSGVELIDADFKSSPIYYNVYGQRVDSSYRGIVVISDGRKMLMKGY